MHPASRPSLGERARGRGFAAAAVAENGTASVSAIAFPRQDSAVPPDGGHRGKTRGARRLWPGRRRPGTGAVSTIRRPCPATAQEVTPTSR